jgi:hypothetical protein
LEVHCNDFVSGTTWCLILLSNNKKKNNNNKKKSVSSSLTSHLFSSPEMKNTPHVTERQMVLEKRPDIAQNNNYYAHECITHTMARACSRKKPKAKPKKYPIYLFYNKSGKKKKRKEKSEVEHRVLLFSYCEK